MIRLDLALRHHYSSFGRLATVELVAAAVAASLGTVAESSFADFERPRGSSNIRPIVQTVAIG